MQIINRFPVYENKTTYAEKTEIIFTMDTFFLKRQC